MLKPGFRKFFSKLALGVAILLVIASPLLWFNIVLDPYGVFLDHSDYSSAAVNNRFTKVKYMIDHPDRFTSFIFGSSRVNFINPAHIPQGDYFNMHSPSALPSEHLRDLRAMILAGVQVKKVIIAVDFLSFIIDHQISETDLPNLPYPSSLKENYKFYKNFALNIPSKELISKTLEETQRERNVPVDHGNFSVPYLEDSIERFPEMHIRAEKFRLPHSFYQTPENYHKGLLHLKELIDFLKNQNIDYVVFINPTHITTYLALNLDAYFSTLKELAAESDFIDFSGLNSVTTDNMNFYETSHYREYIGDRIISRLFNLRDSLLPDDFGFRVTRENVLQQIERHHLWLKDYFENVRMEKPNWQSASSSSGQVAFKKETDNHSGAINSRNIVFKMLDINGKPAEANISRVSSRYMNISGYAVDPQNIMPLRNLASRVNEHLYPVNIIREVHDLDVMFNTRDARYCGWTAVFPVPDSGSELRIEIGMMSGSGLFEPLSREIIIHQQLVLDTTFLTRLNRLEVSTRFTIDQINGERIQPGKIRITADQLTMVGWAVDHKAQQPASKVYVRIGDKLFQADYGQPRKDVADFYNIPAYSRSGWSIEIPVTLIRKGLNRCSLIIVTKDGTGYYHVDNGRKFVVE